MNATDIAAWLGAAAWVPQVIGAVNGWLTRPRVRLVAADRAQVSYADAGLGINVGLAFASERKDGLIANARLRLRHQNGDERVLAWQWMTEQQSQLVNETGESLRVQRQHTVMALKVATTGLTERFVSFSDRTAAAELAGHLRGLYAAFAHHKGQGASDAEAGERVTSSQEFAAFATAVEQKFYLLEGVYEVGIELEEAQNKAPAVFRYELHLTAENVAALRSNTRLAKEYFLASVGLGNYPLLQFRWPELVRKQN